MIHRFWTGPPRPGLDVGPALQSIHELTLMDWTPASLPAAMRRLCETDDPRHASNLVRYALLEKFGGLWVDHDVVPVRRFSGRPFTASFRGRREGCVLWFPKPGHPMMTACLAAGLSNPAGPSSRRSGATVLTEVGAAYPDVRLEPRVIPFDARGRCTEGSVDPWAIHLWDTVHTRRGGPE